MFNPQPCYRWVTSTACRSMAQLGWKISFLLEISLLLAMYYGRLRVNKCLCGGVHFLEGGQFSFKSDDICYHTCLMVHHWQTLPANIRRGKHQNSKENEGNTTKHASTANAATNQNHKRNDDEVEKATSANPTLKDNHHLPLRSLLTRPIIMSIINYGFLAFIDQCFEVLMPLMYSSSISLGGLGFNSFTIGIILGVCGVLNGLFSILAFSKIVETFGVRKVYIVAFANFLFCLAAFPVMSVLARRSGTGIKVWTVLVLQQICYMLAYMGYGEPCLPWISGPNLRIDCDDRMHSPVHQWWCSPNRIRSAEWASADDRLNRAGSRTINCDIAVFGIVGKRPTRRKFSIFSPLLDCGCRHGCFLSATGEGALDRDIGTFNAHSQCD